MPIGGFNAGTWNEAIPAGGESVGLGDDRIRSVKTTLRQALDSEHVWDASGGTVGQHRAGSARAFYGTQSQVSASDTSTVANGRLMVTSDTSRLFSVNSLGRTLLGAGPKALSVDTTASMTFNPQNVRWAMEVGLIVAKATEHVVIFPSSGFSAVPFLQVSTFTDAIGAGITPVVSKLSVLQADSFSVSMVDSSTGNLSAAGIMWMAVGTRAL